KNGFAEKIDVDRLQVLENNLETERENVSRLLTLNVDLLKFQMGMPIGRTLALEESIASVQEGQQALVTDTTAYRGRIEYALLETQKELNVLNFKRIRSEFLPTLSGYYNASKSYQSNDFSELTRTDFPTSVLGLSLTWPLISGGQRTFRVRNARLEILKSENDLGNLRNSINLEISQTQKLYNNSLRSLENQRRNLALAQEILRVSRIKYEQGVGSSLEVTTAETAQKEAQNNYITALYDMLIQRVDLEKATGRINY
ncbi:MAG TPA: TolC family protein, partial [Sphingobacteriaceae bacterium]